MKTHLDSIQGFFVPIYFDIHLPFVILKSDMTVISLYQKSISIPNGSTRLQFESPKGYSSATSFSFHAFIDITTIRSPRRKKTGKSYVALFNFSESRSELRMNKEKSSTPKT